MEPVRRCSFVQAQPTRVALARMWRTSLLTTALRTARSTICGLPPAAQAQATPPLVGTSPACSSQARVLRCPRLSRAKIPWEHGKSRSPILRQERQELSRAQRSNFVLARTAMAMMRRTSSTVAHPTARYLRPRLTTSTPTTTATDRPPPQPRVNPLHPQEPARTRLTATTQVPRSILARLNSATASIKTATALPMTVSLTQTVTAWETVSTRI